MHQIVEIGSDAAKNAEYHLHEERRLHPSLVNQPGQIVEMAEIIAFELEFRSMALAKFLHDIFQIGKSVPEDEVAGHVEELRFPVKLPLAVFVRHREDAEIHRSDIQRGHFGAGAGGGAKPLLAGHAETAAGRDIDHRVGRLLDPRQEPHEQVGIGVRLAGFGIAGVKMDDRGAGLCRLDRGGGDLVRRDRQMFAHRRGMDAAGRRAGDNDGLGHVVLSPARVSSAGPAPTGRHPAPRAGRPRNGPRRTPAS